MDIYREEILDHFKKPRNFGLKKGEGWIKTKEANVSCGDVMEMAIKVVDGRVEAIRFEGEGCAVSMAAGSMLTEMVKGKKLAAVKKITEEKVVERLGIKISAGRRKCAGLGLKSLKKGLEKYEAKK